VDRVLAWVLLLYPRQMRRRYGLEIAELTLDLIRVDGRSPVRLLFSLAVHGLGCRMAWFARTRVATALAVTTSVACVALVNLGAASAKQPASHQTKAQLNSAAAHGARSSTHPRADRTPLRIAPGRGTGSIDAR
jgi:hypothetical protein